MSKLTSKQLKRVRDLHARVIGGSTPQEREAAWKKLDAFLRSVGKTWNDVQELIAESAPATAPQSDPRDTTPPPKDYSHITPADLARYVLQKYLGLQEHEYVAATLWAIHTHLYDQFLMTPRLMLLSPVRNCGKTTALDLLQRLCLRGETVDHITPAAIYQAINTDKVCLLVDEADNLEMSARATLRSVLNSGYRKSGKFSRVISGKRVRFQTFAPIAIAAIGLLPLPLMSRSIVIQMTRCNDPERLQPFHSADTQEIDFIYSHIWQWVHNTNTKISLDPEMPAGIRGRLADNWRPLLAIADACSPAWGAEARAAYVAFSKEHQEEDRSVMLLQDIRQVFDATMLEQIASKQLVRALLELEGSPWTEWTGIRDDQQPRKLIQAALANTLRPFRIHPQLLWPKPRKTTSRCFRGYTRQQFERDWRAYCDGSDTPTRPTQPRRAIGA